MSYYLHPPEIIQGPIRIYQGASADAHFTLAVWAVIAIAIGVVIVAWRSGR